MRSPAEALARAQNTDSYPTGMCLRFVRQLYGIGPVHPHAAAAFRATEHRRAGTPPAGYPVWWTGGSRGFGHVAISAGAGYVISTDVPRSGRVDRVSIATLTRRWGHDFQGWSLDINGATLPEPVGDVVDLSKLRRAAEHDPPRPDQKVTYAAAAVVEAALVAEDLLDRRWADGHFGRATVDAYAGWQRRCGFAGRDADGIPGWVSLTRLGNRHGFAVVR